MYAVTGVIAGAEVRQYCGHWGVVQSGKPGVVRSQHISSPPEARLRKASIATSWFAVLVLTSPPVFDLTSCVDDSCRP